MTEAQALQQRLMKDVKAAMKSGDVVAREAIRFLQSAYRNAEIDKRGPLTGDEELGLLQKQVKQRTESIDQFRSAGREDLVEREEAQLRVIERYLPAQLSDEALDEMVAASVAEAGATGPRDMGKVMPLLLPRIGGRADGKRVSTAVRARLAGG